MIRAAKRPLIVAGGGVIYSEATDALQRLVKRTGIPAGETQAGKGSLPFDHQGALGAIGATGTLAANRVAAEADVVIGVGTRYSDFTTASKTAFQSPTVRFVNVNIAEADADKLAGVPLVGDARSALEALDARLGGWTVDADYRKRCEQLRLEWDKEVSRLYSLGHGPLPAQSEVIGAVNELSGPRDVVVCAAGSMPGDLHKLWRTRDAKGYHVEYGYSTMGYEIAGGLGVKLADPQREVYVMVGDGSYLMMAQETRHLHPGTPEADRDPGRQRGLRLDRRAVTRQRHGRVRHPLPIPFGRLARRRRGAQERRTSCRSTWLSTRRDSALTSSAPATSRSCATRWSPPRRSIARWSSMCRSTAMKACRATRAGGMSPSPRSRNPVT